MIEYEIWEEDPSQYVVGADEVGRGSIGGPIVASSARISFKHLEHLDNVKDSKKLSETKRKVIYENINKTSIEISYASLSNCDIDNMGINYCNKKVLSDVLVEYIKKDDLIYVDHVKDLGKGVNALTKGEDKSIAIALASIMAKVYRDNVMIGLAIKFPEYDLNNNKGYGTKKHLEAISKYGIQEFHRKSFLKNFT
jgi:ribonuclease HII